MLLIPSYQGPFYQVHVYTTHYKKQHDSSTTMVIKKRNRFSSAQASLNQHHSNQIFKYWTKTCLEQSKVCCAREMRWDDMTWAHHTKSCGWRSREQPWGLVIHLREQQQLVQIRSKQPAQKTKQIKPKAGITTRQEKGFYPKIATEKQKTWLGSWYIRKEFMHEWHIQLKNQDMKYY